MRTLTVLTVSPGLTVNELSELTVTEQSTLSRTLDAMEAQGLVRRQARAGDMRFREVHLTDGGRAAFELHWPTMQSMFERMVSGVDAEDYAALVRTLGRMAANLGSGRSLNTAVTPRGSG